jgi:CRISPR/Cas system-associated endoribonuclease Cas2
MAGIPRVAGVIAAISDDGHRAKALEAAERSYCQTILDSGYMGAVARTWRFIILFRLQMELKDRQFGEVEIAGSIGQ